MGFIKKLFGGILAFIQNLFGGKKTPEIQSSAKSGKSKDYYVEFDESPNGKSAETKQSAPSKAAESKKPEPAKAPEPVAVGAPAKAESPQAESTQAEAAKPEPVKAQASSKPKAEKVEAPEPKQPEPKEKVTVKPEPVANFAPTYLNPAVASNGDRRRPGPNMNPFMEMARQVKTPKAKA